MLFSVITSHLNNVTQIKDKSISTINQNRHVFLCKCLLPESLFICTQKQLIYIYIQNINQYNIILLIKFPLAHYSFVSHYKVTQTKQQQQNSNMLFPNLHKVWDNPTYLIIKMSALLQMINKPYLCSGHILGSIH